LPWTLLLGRLLLSLVAALFSVESPWLYEAAGLDAIAVFLGVLVPKSSFLRTAPGVAAVLSVESPWLREAAGLDAIAVFFGVLVPKSTS